MYMNQKAFQCVLHHCDLRMRAYSSLTHVGVTGGRVTPPAGAAFKAERSLSCLHCKGERKPCPETSVLLCKSPKQHGRKSANPLTPLCLPVQETPPTRAASVARAERGDSSARLGETPSLQAAPSKSKAIDWLLLNARKSRTCQARAAGERHEPA